MKVTINGKEHSIQAESLSCEDLLSKVDIPKDGLIAEVDGRIYTVTQLGSATVRDGSKIELIRIMGGG